MRGPCINLHQKWIIERCAYRRQKVTPLIDLKVRQAAGIYHFLHDVKKGWMRCLLVLVMIVSFISGRRWRWRFLQGYWLSLI